LDDVRRLRGPDTNCIVHRREMAAAIGGWDEACRWLEDWDFFARACLHFPGRARWVPHILVDYRQVHGTGADGIRGEAREDRAAEVAGRRYLLEKWRAHLPPETVARLSISPDALGMMRAAPRHG
jgi:hypothetical protein